METKTIKGYKGFDKDLKCRDFQYKIGETYETDNAKICNTGFHFCENPFDVFKYYAPCSNKNGFNRFCEVYGSGEVDRDGSKIACSKIKIGARIKLDGLIKAGVKFILDRVKWDNNKNTGDYSVATNTGYRSAATNTGGYSAATNTGYRSAATNTGDYSVATNIGDCSAATNTGDCSAATNTGYRSAATNTGDCSAATNTGYRSAATNTGDCSAATNTGDCSAATNTGDCSAATNTGDYSVATNTGDCSAATNTGDCSAATNTGNRSAATNTGDYSVATNTGYRSAATNTGDCSAATNTGYRSAATVKGKCSISVVTGKDSKAKGALGCWIVLTEKGDWDGKKYPILGVKAFKVDGEQVKADTFYMLVNGELKRSRIMETKMITIPFDVELAKEIQAGTKPGKITTRDGRDVRIVCWDRKTDKPHHIVALLDTPKFELVTNHNETGESESYNEYNLILQVPEWTQYKEGDVLACEVDNGGGDFCKWYSVLKGKIGDDFSRPYITSYVDYNYDSSYRVGELIYDDAANNVDSIRLATEEEKQKLIKRLQEEDTDKSKGILKRFFGIEEKQECEFEFLQPVLVRANPNYQWLYGNFTHMSGELHFVSGGIGYQYCIPYNDQTKHLLGTTDNWEE